MESATLLVMLVDGGDDDDTINNYYTSHFIYPSIYGYNIILFRCVIRIRMYTVGEFIPFLGRFIRLLIHVFGCHCLVRRLCPLNGNRALISTVFTMLAKCLCHMHVPRTFYSIDGNILEFLIHKGSMKS